MKCSLCIANFLEEISSVSHSIILSVSALWRKRIRGYGSYPMGETDWEKLSLVLMGGARLSKSLINFSVDGWSCIPSLLFTWDQTMVEIMKIMVSSSKGPMYRLLHLVLPTLQQTTADPRLCQRLLDTHRQVCVSLLWGHCSFLLGPVVHRVLFVPSRSLFPQSCVSSGSSMMG